MRNVVWASIQHVKPHPLSYAMSSATLVCYLLLLPRPMSHLSHGLTITVPDLHFRHRWWTNRCQCNRRRDFVDSMVAEYGHRPHRSSVRTPLCDAPTASVRGTNCHIHCNCTTDIEENAKKWDTKLNRKLKVSHWHTYDMFKRFRSYVICSQMDGSRTNRTIHATHRREKKTERKQEIWFGWFGATWNIDSINGIESTVCAFFWSGSSDGVMVWLKCLASHTVSPEYLLISNGGGCRIEFTGALFFSIGGNKRVLRSCIRPAGAVLFTGYATQPFRFGSVESTLVRI